MFSILLSALFLVSAMQDEKGSAKKAQLESLLKAAEAARQAGDSRTMYAKLDEAASFSEHPEVMHKVGHIYASDKAAANGPERALHWYTQAAALGHGESITHVSEALKDDMKLSDSEYSKLVDALESGIRKNDMSFLLPGHSTLAALGKKHSAAGQCAVDLAKRLGYAPDDQQSLMAHGGRPTEWFIVRQGSGTSSSGDKLWITAAELDGLRKGYRRLKVQSSGFTGIKFNRIPLGGGRSLTLKEYTGYRETASAQGQRDAQTILAACRPR